MDPVAAKFIGGGISVIALFGVGIGLGKLFSSLVESIARNPSAKDDLMSTGLICFAMIESVALLAFIVAMCLLFVV
ncbi:MAG: F0F1 ATP synthase subunit C [Holosporales bacterium]|jgi:F-type H+-transporting ATPase subunit c|nr:F0F1 ATP synthase subunit C [Holosporales bacterium]